MIKKISGLFCLVLISMAFSCSSDSDDSGTTPTTGSSITASVDGQAWASMTGGAIANVSQISAMGQSQNVLQIIGAKMDESSVTIQFPIDNLAVGTYTFNNDVFGALTYNDAGGVNVYTSTDTGGTFTVTISQINLSAGTISGTFSGTVLDFDGNSHSITNGTINNVSIMSSDLYSNGTMSLSRNGGAVFTMDANQSDAKYLMIMQNSMESSVSIFGYNATVTSDFGVYNITIPETAAVGTYDLTTASGYSAGIGNAEGQAEFTVSSGSVTITSHNGNNVVGTFSFTASNGTDTVTITNGSFNVTHQ